MNTNHIRHTNNKGVIINNNHINSSHNNNNNSLSHRGLATTAITTPTNEPIDSSSRGKSKSIEETYVKMSPRQHILLRPEPYVGSMQKQTTKEWVAMKTKNKNKGQDKGQDKGKGKGKDSAIVCKDTAFVPAYLQVKVVVRLNPIIKHSLTLNDIAWFI
jgi:hypothetical protein